MFFKISLISILSIWWSAQASAQLTRVGSGSTGGGFVVNCEENPVSEAFTQVLDLFEMVDRGYELVEGKDSVEEEYFNAVDRTYTIQGYPGLVEEIKNEVKANFLRLARSVKFIDREEDLPKAKDLGNTRFIPSQCELKQMAFFDDEASTIYILKAEWDKLDGLNQAALMMHEVWGKSYRRLNEKTSEVSRLTIGHLFIQEGQVPAVREGLPKSAKLVSGDSIDVLNQIESSSFYMYDHHNGSHAVMRFQFSHLFGRAQFAKTWVDFPKIEWTGKTQIFDGRPTCVVTEVEKAGEYVARVYSSMSDWANDDMVKFEIEVGKPIKLSLMKNGEVLNENYLYSVCR